MSLNLKERKIFATAIIVVVVLFCLSLIVGEYPIAISDLNSILLGRETTGMTARVFWRLRLPRTIMVLLAGMGLSLAGSIFQTLFKNPLASPDIIGVTSGANLGAAIAIVVFGNAASSVLVGSSFAGGILVVASLFLLVRITGSRNTSQYILAGIVIKSIAESGIMTLKFFADPEKHLATIEYWAMGSFANITLEKLLMILPFFLIGTIGIVVLRRQVYLLGLSDDESRSLGVNVSLMRLLVLTFATLLVSSIICVTGLIRFLGLISPHIARMILRKNSFRTAVLSSLIGGIILLCADCLVRTVYTSIIPISIITTVVATPLLVFYLVREKGRA